MGISSRDAFLRGLCKNGKNKKKGSPAAAADLLPSPVAPRHSDDDRRPRSADRDPQPSSTPLRDVPPARSKGSGSGLKIDEVLIKRECKLECHL